jgi:ABC-type polysaccharide/polyol phosphate transport system ATPase subunit
MKLKDENNVVQRRAGVVWKNLKVCGSGSSINLQKNVASLLLAPFRPQEFFGSKHEKTILNEFDGCLKSGEMLVVLGRPGSGCSTLLKTLMGELRGLDMKEQSEIHYNGKILFLFIFERLFTRYRYHSKPNVEAIQGRVGLQPGSGQAFSSFDSRRDP